MKAPKSTTSWRTRCEQSTVELALEPVYAVGVAENSRWVRQAAYSLETPYLVSVTAGDSVTANLQVKNTRPTAISGKVRLQLPAGLDGRERRNKYRGRSRAKRRHIPLTFRVGTEEPLGEKTVRLAISEGETLCIAIPLRVQIQRPIAMTVRGLKGEPGKGDVTIRISNRSAQALDGTLAFQTARRMEHGNTGNQGGCAQTNGSARRDRPKCSWTPTWKEGEIAAVEYQSERWPHRRSSRSFPAA